MPRQDRSFTAEDVLRIMGSNLTTQEQEIVLFVLRPEPPLEEADPIAWVLEILRRL